MSGVSRKSQRRGLANEPQDLNQNLGPKQFGYQSQSPVSKPVIPPYSIRNEFFCDKYDILSEKTFTSNFPWEIHASKNLLNGKDVFVHLIKIPQRGEQRQNEGSREGNENQHHLNSAEGLLSIYESFNDGEKFMIVSETFQNSLSSIVNSLTDEPTVLEYSYQLLTGMKNLVKAEINYVNLNPDFIVLVSGPGGKIHLEFVCYGHPFSQLNLAPYNTSSGYSPLKIRQEDISYGLGALMYLMIYKKSFNQGMTCEPKAPFSETTTSLVEKLLSGRGSLSEADIYLGTAHKQLRPRETAQEIKLPSASFSGRYKTISPIGNIYEGDFLNGHRSGQGKYTFKDGHVYEGGWLKGKMDGEGHYKFADGSSYKGGMAKGRFHGRGRYVFANGDVYEGDFVHDRFQGNGRLEHKSGYSLEGTFLSDILHGQGCFYKGQHILYKGGWNQGFYSGKGNKQYLNGDCFEGEWSNGFKEGYGEYKHKDGTYYKGNYHKGKKHCDNAILAYSSGLTYKGPFRNGLKTGHGVLDFPDGRNYTGNFSEDAFDGEGTLNFKTHNQQAQTQLQQQTNTNPSQHGDNFRSNLGSLRGDKYLKYVGTWQRGHREGRGRLDYMNGDYYEGGFKGDKREGEGVFKAQTGGEYRGEWRQGLAHGKGKMVYANGEEYTGDWVQGRKEGQGVLEAKNGEKYEGQFKADAFDGQGVLSLPNGSYYKGSWRGGKMNGKGLYRLSQISFYEGDFKDDLFDGRGTFVDEQGVKFEGEWAKDKRNGFNRSIFPDGRVTEGQYKDDKKEGANATIEKDGSVVVARYYSGLRDKESEQKSNKEQYKSLMISQTVDK